MADNKAAEEHKEQWEKLPGYVKGSMGFSFFLFIVILVVFISVELFLPLYRFYWSDSQGTASRLLVILSLFAVPITLNAAWYFYLRHWQNLRAWVYKNRKEASLFGGALIFGFVLLLYRFPGSGFGGKGLWDWLELLILPAGFAIGGYLINSGIRERELKRTEEQQREQALKNYLKEMNTLMIDKGQNEVIAGKMARGLTLATLRNLDRERKSFIVQFLTESGLVNSDEPPQKEPMISLKGADLEGIKLYYAQLQGANLWGAQLKGAKLDMSNFTNATLTNATLNQATLTGAILAGADLQSANLEGANLSIANKDKAESEWQRTNLTGANLKGANLTGAIITEEQLKQAILDETTIMQDGSNYKPPKNDNTGRGADTPTPAE